MLKLRKSKALSLIATAVMSMMMVFTTSVQPVSAYTNDELMLLARVINAEAGEGCSIEHNQLVGCVVMNRVKSKAFPNTIAGVVYQRGQYSCVGNSRFNAQPSTIAMNAAKYVLDGKAYCPSDVVYQANFPQGSGVYKKFYVHTGYFSSTTYFCRG